MIEEDSFSSAPPEIRRQLTAMLNLVGKEPSLEQMCALLDVPWATHGCDNRQLDWGRLSAYYSDPVWLFNGLFIEQHPESLNNRRAIVEWVVSTKPKRVADYGGGFGSLARMLAKKCPDTEIHVIEPHPTYLALEYAENIPNLSYREEFSGQYDIIIATDVFEHLPDPLATVAETADHLDMGGHYVIANCFYPYIKCHLPSLFHFRYTFVNILRLMNLRPLKAVIEGTHGTVYKKMGSVTCTLLVRLLETLSAFSFPILQCGKTILGPIRRQNSTKE